MKLVQEADEANRDKKLLKSQVEKRRRERMNHSLERLRSMLMIQEPQQQQQQGSSQRRVEKTEILEHTVLFLHKASTGAAPQPHPFQDGFHSCLQRAAHFLGPQGKILWPALDASLAPPSPSSVLHALLLHKSKHSRRAAAATVVMMPMPPAPPPRTPPRGPNWLGTCMESPPVEGPSLGQSVWRPWP
ncbi:hairy and enhancer of split related-7 [Stigmatopora argus]